MQIFLKKLKGILLLSVAIFIFVILLFSAVNAQSTLSLDANFHTISAIASFTNAPNSVTVQYKRASEGTWRSYDSDLVYIDTRATLARPKVSNYMQNTARFKIFGLAPNVTYDVRVTYNGGDGGTLTGQITTLDTTPPNPSLRTIYVDPVSGNDSNNGFSPSTAKQTVAGSFAITQPGDRVWFKPGTYTLSATALLGATRGGTSQNWVRFTKWEGEQGDVIIQGNGSIGPVLNIRPSYVLFDNITIRDSISSVVLLSAYPQANQVWRWFDNVKITDWNINEIQINANGGIQAYNNPERVIITNSYFQRRDVASGTQAGWGYAMIFKNSSDQATYGGRHIIWNNTIVGGFDAISGYEEGNERGLWFINTDIYENTVSEQMDDIAELDGAAINTAFFNNRGSAAHSSVSANPIIVGPAYVFSNQSWDLKEMGGPWGPGGQRWVKTGNLSDGRIYIMHDSSYIPIDYLGYPGTGLQQTNSGFANFWMKNNAVQVSRFIIDITSKQGDGEIDDTDYNSLYTSDATRFVKWWNVEYDNLAAYKTGTGNETYGLSRNMAILDWVNAANGNFALVSSSSLIDAGMVINGINNDVENTSWNYKGSAPDIGAVEYDSGAPPPPSFNFNVNVSPNNATIAQGENGTATVTVALTSGSTQSVSFSVSGLPSGASASFGPTSCNPTCSSILTFTTTPTAATGTFSITITGTGGSVTKTAPYSLTVNQAPVTTFTISNIAPLYLFRDSTNTLSITGSNFNLATDFYLRFASSTTTVSSITAQTQSDSYFNTAITSIQVNTLPVGFYDLRLERSTDSQSQTYSQQILVTVLGDVSSQTAGTRDGKVDIYDVSRLLSKWGSILPADLAEADINAGPGNISQGKIDLYDANKMMMNWRP